MKVYSCQICNKNAETFLPNEVYVDDQHPNSSSILVFQDF